MRNLLIALLAGLLFGAGLALSNMIYPLKVLAFLDLSGNHWDPSLAFVMMGALLVTIPAFALILQRQQPLYEQRFYLPVQSAIDNRLLAGSALFGSGWGLAGYCPGPAIAMLTIQWQEAVPFLLFAVFGGWLADYLFKRDD